MLYSYREEDEVFGCKEDTEVTALLSWVDVPAGSDLTLVDIDTVVVGVVRTVVAAVELLREVWGMPSVEVVLAWLWDGDTEPKAPKPGSVFTVDINEEEPAKHHIEIVNINIEQLLC